VRTTKREASRASHSEVTPAPREAQTFQLRVPAATILKVCVALALIWIAVRLIPTLLLLLLSLLFAVTLAPIVARLEKRGLSRGFAVLVIAAMTLLLIGSFVAFAIPPLVSQTVEVSANLPSYRQNVQQRLSPQYPAVAAIVDQVFQLPSSPEVARSLKQPLAWGRAAVEVSIAIVLVMAITLYLLIDGKRVYAWLLAYVPRRHRRNMALTLPAMSDVIVAYVQGQLITSVLAGIYALAVLSVLRVPAAIPLAVLAAVCDVLPVVGAFASGIPAVLFALTVSPVAAAAVLSLYLAYHALENYVIIPKVYGSRLRIPTLVVFIALLVGGALYGVVGAVLILPVFAAYPIIEKIWLHEYLSDELVADHKELARTAESGSERAVDAVLRGARHPTEIRDSAANEAGATVSESRRKG
jgi:putative heme transporter